MKVTKEVCCKSDFDFWSGAVATVEALTDREFETVISCIEDCYPEGITETELNDIFWFEQDWIAELLGYNDWEAFEEENAED